MSHCAACFFVHCQAIGCDEPARVEITITNVWITSSRITGQGSFVTATKATCSVEHAQRFVDKYNDKRHTVTVRETHTTTEMA